MLPTYLQVVRQSALLVLLLNARRIYVLSPRRRNDCRQFQQGHVYVAVHMRIEPLDRPQQRGSQRLHQEALFRCEPDTIVVDFDNSFLGRRHLVSEDALQSQEELVGGGQFIRDTTETTHRLSIQPLVDSGVQR